jgi:GAF domain-containing protein
MQMEGRVVGALELINKKGGDVFSEQDLNIANFVAHQLAEYLARQDKI